MAIDYEVIVKGSNVRMKGGFIGLVSLTLVDTAHGPMLFDVGHAANRLEFVAALARRGLKASDIPRVFLSHLHCDHVKNLDLFPRSTKVFLGRAEWDYAASPHKDDVYHPWLVREFIRQFDLNLLEGSGEFEPGLRYIPAPGHTPGCYALVLEIKEKGTVVIAGDALKFPKEAFARKSDLAFGSPEDYEKTISTILSIADRIVPGHFPEMIKRDGTFVWEEPAEFVLQIL
jgi:glyoxylase-like metal-dependent hydrolase (beta-lactamase superfamily II)